MYSDTVYIQCYIVLFLRVASFGLVGFHTWKRAEQQYYPLVAGGGGGEAPKAQSRVPATHELVLRLQFPPPNPGRRAGDGEEYEYESNTSTSTSASSASRAPLVELMLDYNCAYRVRLDWDWRAELGNVCSHLPL